jgi:hypothetical protein
MRSGDGTGGESSASTCRVWVDDGKKLLKVWNMHVRGWGVQSTPEPAGEPSMESDRTSEKLRLCVPWWLILWVNLARLLT